MASSVEAVGGSGGNRAAGGNGDGRRSLYGINVDRGHQTDNLDRGQSIGVLRGAAGPIPAAPPARTHRFCLAQHPQFLLTFAEDIPQKLKLRKRITAWPLQLTLRADYSRRLRAFQYGFSCKDVFLKGSVHVDLQNQQIEYRKLFNTGAGAALALTARCSMASMASLGQQAPLNPVLGLQWHMGGHGAARWARDGKFDLRKKLRLTRNLGIEACGTAELPLPQAQYALQNAENQSQFSFGGDDAVPFHLHLDQLNLCLDV